MVLLKSIFSEITEYSIKNRNLQWRSEGPAGPVGPATAERGVKGARQEEVVAVNPWPEAQTSCLRGGGRKSSLRHWKLVFSIHVIHIYFF